MVYWHVEQENYKSEWYTEELARMALWFAEEAVRIKKDLNRDGLTVCVGWDYDQHGPTSGLLVTTHGNTNNPQGTCDKVQRKLARLLSTRWGKGANVNGNTNPFKLFSC